MHSSNSSVTTFRTGYLFTNHWWLTLSRLRASVRIRPGVMRPDPSRGDVPSGSVPVRIRPGVMCRPLRMAQAWRTQHLACLAQYGV
jgi:hypothetical protein